MARSSVARGTVLGVAAQVWHLLTAFLLFHFLSARLGPVGFGQWRVALSVLTYFEMLVNTGFVQVAVKRLAETPGDTPRVQRAAYLGQAALATGLFAAAMLTAGPIASALRDPSLAFLIRVSALDIPVVAAFMIAGSILLGRQDFGRQAFGMSAYATAKFVAIAFLVWRGFSVPGALIGNALASLVGFAVMFVPWEGERVKFKETVAEARGMSLAAVPFLLLSLIGGVSYDADLWFVQALRGGAVVGLYGAALALADIPTFLAAGLSRALFPSVARAGAENDEALVSRYATQGVRLALFVTILGVAVIAATGREALAFVYTSAFQGAAPAFTILMVAGVGRNVRATCADVLMGRGRRMWVLIIISASTILEVVLLALVTPRFGLLGAAGAAAVSAIIAGVAAVISLRGLVGWKTLLTFVRCSVAAAIVGYALSLVHPAGGWLIVAYVVAAIVYAALLLALREIDSDDVASIRAVAGR